MMFRNGTSFVIDLSYIQRKKSTLIRKHLFYTARNKNIDIVKVTTLARHKSPVEANSPAQPDKI
jgi:hypothetical protein